MKFTKSVLILTAIVTFSSFAAFSQSDHVLRVTSCQILIPMKITSPNSKINATQISAKDLKITSTEMTPAGKPVGEEVEGSVGIFGPIENPYNIVLLLDMTDYSKAKVLQMGETALAFIKQARQHRNKLGQARINKIAIVGYGNYTHSAFTLLTDDPNELKDAIVGKFGNVGNYIAVNSDADTLQMRDKQVAEKANSLAGTTAADAKAGRGSEGLLTALGYIRSSILSTRPSQENAIVIVANPSSLEKYSMDQIKTQAQETSALIYAVQLAGKNEAALAPDPKLQTLAEVTGGSFYLTDSKDRIIGATESFKKIDDELSDRHYASYVPPHDCTDGKTYKLKVAIKGSNEFVVKTRMSYIANAQFTDAAGQNMVSSDQRICHQGPAEIGDLVPGTVFVSKNFTMPGKAFTDAAEVPTCMNFDTCSLDKPVKRNTHRIDVPAGEELKVEQAWSSTEAFDAILVNGVDKYRLLCEFHKHRGQTVTLAELQDKVKNVFEVRPAPVNCTNPH